ncbi:helix-turn-helix transcriptional regulator [Bacillus toyonensis]|uniref:helix-turn-helix domain-containing protein n=1 Tax=Bacillus TaxID=1386 RepID=UPI000BEC8DF2|nr:MULTISPECIES: helix-turn-helix transcriptional regulator [Bacillus cereus group]PDY54671.1 transcriptional regulator [Bacillus toyonensis]PEK45990.1 transcriptional regulator [Bacillus toyonensis]PEM96607.1 transcriptional regulator [Bacillus toyonensis]PGA55921.1 transcriptional regulator [Bacillus toyonensis]PHE89318.1 transcriptional regulator [Bacillus toyonensis]
MFGTKLNFLRKEKKLRQEDMAKHLGIARTTYAMYEQGNREPDYDTLQKLADFFDVSVDYLLGRTEKRNNKELNSKDFFTESKLNLWFKDIENAPPEKLEELKQFWEFIKQKEKNRKPKDTQK